jgi:YebC/PmpR family DNA-binding regulatory protein
MAGHSQFKNIMHRKGAQDKKRAKVFGKLIRELTVAARAGLPDPDSNPRLRTAFVAARAANMPKETMERAIKRGAGDGVGEAYAEVRYEGYGPGGVAIIVEALTDNRNRTAGEVRSAFAKLGGTLGETGSVAFQFNRVGLICYPAEAGNAEALFEAALDAGADDCASLDDGHEITTAPEALHEVRDGLEQRIGTPRSAELTWRALAGVEVGEDDAANLIRLLEVLDDNEDVQSVSANYDMSEDVLTQLTA